jgi:PAS domain S-box-containing protein
MTLPYDSSGKTEGDGAAAYRSAAARGAVTDPSRGPGSAALLDLLPDAAIIFRRGHILHVNARGLTMFGAKSMDALVGRRMEEFLVPMPAGLSGVTPAPGAAGRQIADSTVLRHDGMMVEVELFVAFTCWDDRPATFLMLRDITERRMTERALQTHIDELEETLESSTTHFEAIAGELHAAKEAADAASRTKSEFLANMSHELRTPLNAIMGFSEIIKNEMFGHIAVPQYVEYARDIYSSGAHLLDIINDILDLSKVESGKFDLTEENVAVEEVVFAVCNIIKGKADEKNLHIAPRLPGVMPRLYADKRALKQMMLNLLSNAVKFTPKDGEVCISAGVDDDGAVEIVVRDSGIGIAAEDMDKVFAPFGQVDSALAREHEGTGLGVPLVKAMVELHGGTLTIDSTPGKGSAVTLRFPPERSVRAEAA